MNLTIKDISKPVILKVNFANTAVNVDGQEMAEVSVSGKINRRGFGLTWDGVNDAGELIVGEEIRLSAQLKLIKQAKKASIAQLKECVL